MSKSVAVRLVNTHDQLVAAGGGIAITKTSSPGRSSRASGFSVYRVNAAGQELVTNKTAAWYEHGKKVFHWHGPTRERALDEAKAWIATTYDEQGPWKRNALGDYVPERIFKAFPLPRPR